MYENFIPWFKTWFWKTFVKYFPRFETLAISKPNCHIPLITPLQNISTIVTICDICQKYFGECRANEGSRKRCLSSRDMALRVREIIRPRVGGTGRPCKRAATIPRACRDYQRSRSPVYRSINNPSFLASNALCIHVTAGRWLIGNLYRDTRIVDFSSFSITRRRIYIWARDIASLRINRRERVSPRSWLTATDTSQSSC